ncbi:hypothetical protein F8S13_21285 [Chloroflexia bacterium SDU3-3]|nr:hypothetical protein F8S13_21285 [Chloroflexia bacterium SDU3-3]
MWQRSNVQAAVDNNIVWCETVYRSHGRPGQWSHSLWYSEQEGLPLYPRAITRAPEQAKAQLQGIRQLRDAAPHLALGVKDSFHALDLSAEGFRSIIQASWVWRSADTPAPASAAAWSRITTPQQLAHWEQAWQADPANAPAESAQLFQPALLHDARIGFFAAYRGEQIVGGVVANRSSGVVGISNTFGDDLAGGIAAVIAAFPRTPLAGYESGDALAAALDLGFEQAGPLQIWVRA